MRDVGVGIEAGVVTRRVDRSTGVRNSFVDGSGAPRAGVHETSREIKTADLAINSDRTHDVPGRFHPCCRILAKWNQVVFVDPPWEVADTVTRL
jgi:hypothetical protein